MGSFKSKVICVLGMHRSGTSAITRAVNIMGAYVGEESELLPPREDNPEGFWEFQEFVSINDQILKEFNFAWDAVNIFPDNWWTLPIVDTYKEQIKRIITEKFINHSVWVFKDPRTCILLPLWKHIFEEMNVEATYLISIRNPLDIAASLLKRDGYETHKSVALWGYYTVSALYWTIKEKRLFVQYDDFLDNSYGYIESFSEILGLTIEKDDVKTRLSSFLKPGLRHSVRDTKEFIQNDEYPANVRELYRICSVLTSEVECSDKKLFNERISALFHEVTESNRMWPHIRKKDKIQVFYRTEKDASYSESNSVNQFVKLDNYFQDYVFLLPGDVISPLRIDPSDTTDLVAIQSIQILTNDSNPEVLEIWSGLDLFQHVSQGENVLITGRQDKLLCISLNSDPYVYIHDFKETARPITIKIRMAHYRLSQEVAGIFELDYKEHREGKEQLLDQINQNLELVTVLNDRLNEKQLEINNLNNVLNEKQLEINNLSNVLNEKQLEINNLSNVLHEKQLEINDLNNVLTENQVLIKQLNNQIIHQLQDFNEKLNLSHVKIASLEDELNEAKKELADTKSMKRELLSDFIESEQRLREAVSQISEFSNSRSWKLTRPLRAIGKGAKGMVRSLKRKIRTIVGERDVSISPLNDLQISANGKWISIGNDPHFKVNSPITKGWVEISYTGLAAFHTPITLYYDTGEGMSAQQVLTIGQLNAEFNRVKWIVNLPEGIQGLRLDPGDQAQTFAIYDITVRPIFKPERVIRPLYVFFKKHGFTVNSLVLLNKKLVRLLKNEGWKGLVRKNQSLLHWSTDAVTRKSDYDEFLKLTSKSDQEWEEMSERSNSLMYRPLISVLVPVYNVDEKWLRLCVRSVQHQIYTNWELCLVDDNSTRPHIRQVLTELADSDNRIKVKFREMNGHISATSNDALEMANGEFIALLDHDDELTRDALYENVRLLNECMNADVIYSDEDKITVDGVRHSPYFKPGWSPDTLLSQMYTCHLTVYRKSVVVEAGGFRVGYEGSQDYDLMLRVTEITNHIYHIPKILYHWRTIPNSTAANASVKNYSHETGLKALQDTIRRRKIDGWVEGVEDISNLYRLHYRASEQPKISIIIPSKNMSDVLDKCLSSIFSLSTYPNYEVIVVDNGSTDPETDLLYDKWAKNEPNRFFVHAHNIPFNYSKLNNFGVAKATGELLLLLNNDVEVITGDWLDGLAGQAIRPEIGAVGANLLYPDDTLQHAGVVLGLGGVAGHSHKYYPSNGSGYFHRLKMISNYTAVTAACLMIRKTVYEEVGGFEEELQVAFNDVDFCLKVWKAGYNNVWLPQVKLYHYESKSRGHENTPEKQKRFQGEVQWMRSHWAEELDNDPCYNPNLTKDREDFSIGAPANGKGFQRNARRRVSNMTTREVSIH